MSPRIMAVDDEPDILMVIQVALQSEGHEVRTARSGEDCLEAVAGDPPDLFILDIMMPGMTGIELLGRLKAQPETAQVPVIMLTGLSDRARIREALTGGVDHYIIKPFDFEDLVAKVGQTLRGERI